MPSRRLMLMGALALAASCAGPGIAQSSQERPKLKDFGSSLKRLKWDPVKQTSLEAAPAQSGKAASDDDVVRIETNLVVCDVQVRDRQGRVVTNLKRDDLIVTEDGTVQPIEHFSQGSDLSIPRSIVLVIDHSASQRIYLDNSIQAAETLVDKLAPKDTMAIVTDDVEILVDFTGDRQKLKKGLASLRKKVGKFKFGRSFQFSALMAVVREMFSVEDIRPIVILQTDGDENGLLQPPDARFFFLPILPAGAPAEIKKRFAANEAKYIERAKGLYRQFSLNDLCREIEHSRATVYAVIPGQRLIDLPHNEEVSRVRNQLDLFSIDGIGVVSQLYSPEQLDLITEIFVRAQAAAAQTANVSGGWAAFLETPENAERIYSDILSDLNSRWIVGYYPTNKTRDGKRRNVTIAVRDHPDYVVTGRKSYYAPGPETQN